MNALTPTNNNLVVFFFPGMTSLFQAFVLQLAARKKIITKARREEARYGKQNYFRLPPCGVTLCTNSLRKENEMKRSSALSTLQNGSFQKATLHFLFFLLPYYLNILIWSYSQLNKYFCIILITSHFRPGDFIGRSMCCLGAMFKYLNSSSYHFSSKWYGFFSGWIVQF